jgi:hypothetical protein
LPPTQPLDDADDVAVTLVDSRTFGGGAALAVLGVSSLLDRRWAIHG